jgi:Cu/Ag efflux pump CusA
MLKPLAAAAVGGIAAALPVALWLMPALYRLVVRDRPVPQEAL